MTPRPGHETGVTNGPGGRETGAATAPALLLFVPLRMERAVLPPLPATVVRTGMGPRRAAAAARRGRTEPAAAVAVAGVCGALTDDLRPGDVVVATDVWADGEAGSGATLAGGLLGAPAAPVPGIAAAGPLIAALRAHGVERIHAGPVVSSPRIVRGAHRERLAAAGAIATDMESAWLVEAAAGRPLAVLRVVSDTPATMRSPAATLRSWTLARRTLRRAAPALADWAAAAGDRRVLLAAPRSFCAGARRAIETVERALEIHGPPVYVRRQIVHNRHVVDGLRERGVVFVEAVTEMDPGSLCIFSAHGVSPQVREEAQQRGLRVIDATCPLVAKVHAEARRFAQDGYHIILIGHPGHDEVEATVGEAPACITVIEHPDAVDDLHVPDSARVAYLTQTTLALDDVQETVERLQTRFPDLRGPDTNDICYATSNRQAAVAAVAREADLVLVIGSANSSNSLRLVEIAEHQGCRARLIDDETAIDPLWLRGAATVGVTAGASAAQERVDGVLAALAGLGTVQVEERRVAEESQRFTLPPEVREKDSVAERATRPAFTAAGPDDEEA